MVLALNLVGGAVGCAPSLVTPEQAQDAFYDHLSRAETARLFGRPKLASVEVRRADAFRRLIREGKTTTPQEALAGAALHRTHAETYQKSGYTRLVSGELDRATRYEDFALRTSGITRDDAQRRATAYLDLAAEHEGAGRARFAEHYREQARKLQRIVAQPGARESGR